MPDGEYTGRASGLTATASTSTDLPIKVRVH